MKIAIMQPYFAPYEGYFRLFSETDLFVVYDCVQFPRRGWVHRNKLLDRNGAEQWLTLPLEHTDFDAKIKDLRFGTFSRERMDAEMRRFPAFDDGALPATVLAAVEQAEGMFTRYAVDLLEVCCAELSIPFRVAYSSQLGIPEDVRGQDRILAICRRLGATTYVNAPGGRDLYQAEAFAAAGIELQFLQPWMGRTGSILRVLSERVAV